MINLVSGLQDIYYRYIQFLEIPNDLGNTCVQCKLDFFKKKQKCTTSSQNKVSQGLQWFRCSLIAITISGVITSFLFDVCNSCFTCLILYNNSLD